MRHCRGCGEALTASKDFGWECDCGIVVCLEQECFDEYFKRLADDESMRCRSCGNVI